MGGEKGEVYLKSMISHLRNSLRQTFQELQNDKLPAGLSQINESSVGWLSSKTVKL